jgi:hypothetical protein
VLNGHEQQKAPAQPHLEAIFVASRTEATAEAEID